MKKKTEEILKEITEVMLMPELSKSTSQAIISKWHKNIGDYVSKGDLFVSIKIAEAIIDVDSYPTGILLFKAVNEGEKLSIGEVLIVLGKCKHH